MVMLQEYKAIDIETIANEDVIDRLPDPKVDSRLKDPDKIKAAIEDAKVKQIADMALSPLTGRVASVAVYDGNFFTFEHLHTTKHGSNEKDLIEHIFSNFIGADESNYATRKIITCNGINFDIPYLYTRAMILRASIGSIPMTVYTRKYTCDYHIDIAQVLGNWSHEAKYNSLDKMSRFVLDNKKEDFDVTRIIDIIESGDVAELKKYNEKDAQLTFEIAKQMNGYLF